ncbi:hypothetical protein CsSME_00016529 [Camellia sinensis var. sinensis]
MGSVREFYQKLDKVTSCVVALLYWLCEHTNIVATCKPIMFPRFLKWNISTLLVRTRGLDLTSEALFQVRAGRLVREPYEKVIIAREDFDKGPDGNVDAYREIGGRDSNDGTDRVVGDGRVDDDVSEGDDHNDGVFLGGVGGKLGLSGSDDTSRIGSNMVVGGLDKQGIRLTVSRSSHVMREGGDNVKLTEALVEIDSLHTQSMIKDSMIMKLQDEVEQLKRMKEKQAVDIIGGFTCMFKVKDDKFRKMVEENSELRKTIGRLEDQLAEQAVHNVTQAFRGMGVGCDDGICCVGMKTADVHTSFGAAGVHGVGAIAQDGGYVWISNQYLPSVLGGVTGTTSTQLPEVAVVGPSMQSSDRIECGQSTLVRNIKSMVRGGHRMSDFAYLASWKVSPKVTIADDSNVVEVTRFKFVCGAEKNVIDVDAVTKSGRQWSGFDINDHL